MLTFRVVSFPNNPAGVANNLTCIDRINERRKESLDAIAAGLNGLKEDYTQDREGCSYECSAIRLGALVKSLHKLKLVGHPPETPFGHASVMHVTSLITTMKTPNWYDSQSIDARRSSGYYSSLQAHQCPKAKSGKPKTATLAEFGSSLGNRVKGEIEGLRLADFTSNTEKL